MTAVTVFRHSRAVSSNVVRITFRVNVDEFLRVPASAVGELKMSRPVPVCLLLLLLVIAAVLTGCSRDPNVRKQKYFDSGEKYFAEAKYREAAIQYANAIQIDSRFAQAHYQLGQSYLKLGDMNRAFPQLRLTDELAPDNYRAHTDLANLLLTARN